jgi:hypothetical protein
MSILKPTRAIQLNKSHPLSRGIVGCWLMNEGGGNKVYDLSGNNNTGIFYGNPTWVAGKFGSCLSFDGNVDYVNIAYILPTTGSISLWYYVKPYYDYQTILDNSVNENYWEMWIYGDGRLRARVQSDTADVQYDLDNLSGPNNWYHIVWVWNNTGAAWLYVNGILRNTDTEGAMISAGTNFYLAGGNAGNTKGNGTIDDVILYNRALSAAEIHQIYREPFCMFERVTTPAVFSIPFIDLAGSSPAQSSTSATAKLTKRISGTLAATTNVTAILKIIGEVLIAGSIDTSAVPSGKLTLNYRGPWLRSPLRIERQWLTDALFNGMTDSALKLGTILSSGWFWTRPSGCSVLYRGTSMEQIDFANILAVVEQDTGSMSPPSFVRHNSDSTYFYILRRFNNCGCQERTLQASVKMTFDADGNLARSQPNNIFAARADQVDGDKVQLVWFYCPLEQSSQPALFKIYCDGGTGQIDFENPIAEIRYHGIKYYGYITDTLSAVRYLFAIRVEDVSGMQNNSSAQIIIQISTESPDTPEILSVEAI